MKAKNHESELVVLDYKEYRVTEVDNQVIVENVRDFNPVHIFECGQCFRWIKQEDGSYTGVVRGKAVRVYYENGKLTIANTGAEEFTDLWFDYFDLGRNYNDIKTRLGKDEIMREAIKFGYGIRILRQDIWEVLVSFIISANNRIPRIMKTVEIISKVYGDRIVLEDKDYYSFPTVDKLAGSDLESLSACKGGFRCKYILHTSQMVRDGVLDLYGLSKAGTNTARSELTRLSGVGDKVADCVLLFSGTKYDVFPTDVWVKRVMEELYFKREASFKEIQEFARDYFGNFSGIAQQYLFYYAREHKIGVK